MDLEILIAENDSSLRISTAEFLRNFGLKVREAVSIDALKKALQIAVPNIVLISWEMANADSLESVREIRLMHPKIGIIAFAKNYNVVQRELAYLQGADVFINWSFDLAQLFEMVRTLGRRIKLKPQEQLHATLILQPDFCRLRVPGGRLLVLQPEDIRFLQVLSAGPGAGLGFNDILKSMGVMSTSDKEQFHLHTRVQRLRKKLESDVTTAKLIESVHGVGYRLSVDLKLTCDAD